VSETTRAPWKLSTANLAEVRSIDWQAAVLPFGATEPHNLHLPYGMDHFEADLIGERICAAAWERGVRVLLLPTIPFGTESNLREFPCALNVYPSTLTALTADLIESLETSGIRKVLLLNSHGGNDLKPVLRELYGSVEAHLFLCDWFRMIDDVSGEIFDESDDHAGEMETSLALACWPEFVARNPDDSLQADEGEVRPFRIRALTEGWVSITRPWHLLTTNAGAGNPHAATAEKGERLLAVITERLSEFLVELATEPLDETFPFS